MKKIVDTVYIFKKGLPLVKPEASGGKNQKYHHRVLFGRITGDGLFFHHQFISLECCIYL